MRKMTGLNPCFLFVLEKMLLILKPKYNGGKSDHYNTNPISYTIIEMLPMNKERITAVVTWNAVDGKTYLIK